MRASILFASLGCAACEATPDEGPFLETHYVRYLSDQPFAPCGGLARETDKQVEFLFDLLGEPYPPPLSIEYEWVEDNSTLTCSDNASGCAQATVGGAAIESVYLAYLHELAHAAHLLTIGTSHRVLTEGFASYASSQPRVADASRLPSTLLTSFRRTAELGVTCRRGREAGRSVCRDRVQRVE